MPQIDLHARDVTGEAEARRRQGRLKLILQCLAIGAAVAFTLVYLLT